MTDDGSVVVRVDPALFPQDGPAGADHCSAHGRPAARRVDMALQSRVESGRPRWLRLNVLGIAAEAAERAEKVRVVRVHGWPLCASCARKRAAWFAVFLFLLVGSLALIAGAAVLRGALGSELPAAGPLGVTAILALLAAPLPFVLGSLPRLTRARAAGDGNAILVDGPAPAFLSDVERGARPADR